MTDFKSAKVARELMMDEMFRVEQQMYDHENDPDTYALLKGRKRHLEQNLGVIRRYIEDERHNFQTIFTRVVEDYLEHRPGELAMLKQETAYRMEGHRKHKYSPIQKAFI